MIVPQLARYQIISLRPLMATSSTTCSVFLLLLTLSLASLHVHARDSQFFSKVTTSNNIPKQLLPTKEQEPLNKPEQEPNTGGYGLYGHDSGQLPPTTTTTENLPYETQTQIPYNKESNPNLVDGLYYNNDANYMNKQLSSNSNNGDQYYNNDAYKQQGMSDTRFMDNAYTTPITNNNNGDRFYNNEAYVTKPQGMSNTRFTDNAYTTPVTNNNFNDENLYNNREHGIGEAKLGVTNGDTYNSGGTNEKHGMSDTRVMENGRYYYDLDSEKYYNPNNYNNNHNENSRGFNSRNEYDNNRGNYGNSFKGRYGNNENSYEANNFVEGYNGNQEEFPEIQDEQFNP